MNPYFSSTPSAATRLDFGLKRKNPPRRSILATLDEVDENQQNGPPSPKRLSPIPVWFQNFPSSLDLVLYESTRKNFQMTGSSHGDLFHELLHWVRKIELGPPRSESVGIAAYLHTTLSYGFIMRFLYSESCFLSLLHTMVLNHSFYRNSSMSYLKEIKSVIFGYLRFNLQIGFNFLWKHISSNLKLVRFLIFFFIIPIFVTQRWI